MKHPPNNKPQQMGRSAGAPMEEAAINEKLVFSYNFAKNRKNMALSCLVCKAGFKSFPQPASGPMADWLCAGLQILRNWFDSSLGLILPLLQFA